MIRLRNWYRKSAEQECDIAQFHLGLSYASGAAIPRTLSWGIRLTMVSTINRVTSLDLLAGMEEAEKVQVEKQRTTELWR
jgi:TPR repeat protein